MLIQITDDITSDDRKIWIDPNEIECLVILEQHTKEGLPEYRLVLNMRSGKQNLLTYKDKAFRDKELELIMAYCYPSRTVYYPAKGKNGD
jgi:hypothetical protein